MNLDVLKMQVGGIKSLTAIDKDNQLVIATAGNDQPVVTIEKSNHAIGFQLGNFQGSGLDFGLLMMAISNAYTQGNAAMQEVNTLDFKDPNVIANLDMDGKLTAAGDNELDADNLNFKALQGIMSYYRNQDMDPYLGVMMLLRSVDKHGLAQTSNTTQTPAGH